MKSPEAPRIHKPTSLVDLLRLRGTGPSNQKGYTFFRGDEVEDFWLKYEDLHLTAERIAAALKELCGVNRQLPVTTAPRVVILAPPSAAYLQAFFGTLYAGMVVVTAYPPRARRRDQRLERIVEDSGATIALADTSCFERREFLTQTSPRLAKLEWLNIDQLASDLALSSPEIDIPPDSLAVLQYTSGSTSAPKGVCLTHGNLIANLQMIYTAFELGSHEDHWAVSWLPPFHDMGLIGGLLQSIYANRSTHVIPPAAFVQKPMRWLQAITKYGAAISGGPNFAFDLCVDKIPPEQREGLDLRCWTLAFSGAEPIQKSTLDRFASAFSPYGFDSRAFYPCYGLAEATLLVSGGPRFRKTPTIARKELGSGEKADLVSCGKIADGMKVRIVDPQTLAIRPDGESGEVWISGANVSPGYWNQSELNHRVFAQSLDHHTEKFMRTGDLGVLKENELYIAGRLKELIVIRGRNFQPTEIEMLASTAHSLCIHNSSAAFEIARDGNMGLAIVQEVERIGKERDGAKAYADICRAINHSLVDALDLQPSQICLISKRSLPKTSSGKIKRLEIKEKLLRGELEVLYDSNRAGSLNQTHATSNPIRDKKSEISSRGLTEWLVNRLANQLKSSPQSIDINRPLVEYGLDSVSAVQIAGELESYLGESIAPTLFYDAPTIHAVTTALRPPQQEQSRDEDSEFSPCDHSAALVSTKTAKDDVAIVGMACRLPGCKSIDQFWSLLQSGRSTVSLPPETRLRDLPQELHETYGGWLDEIDQFDAELFGISPREAASIDPQHRLVLEIVWRAIEDAHLDPRRLCGTKTGVFVGLSNRDYERYLRDRKRQLNVYDMTGNAASMVAHRVSYHLDLTGPSLTVDTACSSSLVALHQAIRSIQAGDCELAIVAGVNLMLSPEVFQTLGDAQMLSPDHLCHTFDARANGYVRGEGCVAIVVSSKKVAISTGLPVRAIVCGSAINQDGLTAGITAPNGQSQVRLYQSALKDANVSPSNIELIEAHGTGTPLGDPIEFHSLNAVYGRLSDDRSRPCALTAVKANLGHLEAAAGLTSLLKVVLQLEKGEIVPQPHFKSANPLINFHGSRLEIPDRPRSWTSHPNRCAAVSSFGFGGTNAHILLRGANDAGLDVSRSSPIEPSRTKDYLFALSATNRLALEKLATSLARWIAKNPQLSPQILSQSLLRQKTSGRYRLAFIDHQLTSIGSHLRRFGEGKSSVGMHQAVAPANKDTKIAFLFSGNQIPDQRSGQQLFQREPTFQYWIHCLAEYVASRLRMRCLLTLSDASTGEPFRATVRPGGNFSQEFPEEPCKLIRLFAIQYALAQTIIQWGFRPTVVCGYGFGEYAAAAVAGVMPWEQALEMLAIHAGALQTSHQSLHTLVVLAPIEALIPLLTESEHPPELRAIDYRDHLVFTGTDAQIKAFKAKLKSAHILVREVPKSNERLWIPPVVPDQRMEQLCKTLSLNPPSYDFVSCMTGSLANSEVATIDYWTHHLRDPIQFASAAESLASLHIDASLEIGPGHNLGMLTALANSKIGPVLPVMPHRQQEVSARQSQDADAPDEYASLLGVASELFLRGADPILVGNANRQTVPQTALPGHPFMRHRHWIESTNFNCRLTPNDDVARHVAAEEKVSSLSSFHDIDSPADPKLTTEDVIRSLVNSRRKHASGNANFPQSPTPPATKSSIESYSDAIKSLDHLIRLFITRALHTFLPSHNSGDLIDEETLRRHPQLCPRHRKLIGRFLKILAEEDWLQEDPQQPSKSWKINQFPLLSAAALHEVIAEVDSNYRFLTNELNLVSRCGFSLPELLRGELDPLQVLFPEGDSRILQALYSESPLARAANQLITETTLAVLNNGNLRQPLRILEVGGGTGGTTATLLPAITPLIDEYCFTDASPLLIGQAREHLGNNPILRYATFDIERGPDVQQIPLHHYDLVIAANVLHATADLTRTLTNLKACLKPGGHLIALEGIRPQPFLDLVFGLTEGWWKFIDHDLRPDYPLLSTERWNHLFSSLPFDSFAVVPYPPGFELVSSDQVVLVAQTSKTQTLSSGLSPSIDSQARPQTERHHWANVAATASQTNISNPWIKRFQDASGPSRKSTLEGYFLHTLDQVLERKGVPLDLDAPVNTLGVDSLLAIQLQNRLRSDLGLAVPMVAFLQGSSIRQLIDAALKSQQSPEALPPTIRNQEEEPDGNQPCQQPQLKSDESQLAKTLKFAPALTPDAGSKNGLVDDGTDREPPPGNLQSFAPDGADAPNNESAESEERTSIESTGELSIGQQALWFLYQRNPQSPAYNFAFAAKTSRRIDLGALQHACRLLLQRHPALRTAYRWHEGQPRREILSNPSLQLHVENVETVEDQRLLEKIREQADHPFDLAAGEVIRFRIYTAKQSDILSIAMHHIAADLWSMDLLIRELQWLYNQGANENSLTLPPLEATFESYVDWENQLDNNEEGELLWQYWERNLSGAPHVLHLPTSRPRPAEQTYEGRSYQWTVDPQTETGLREIARTEKTTLYTVILTAYQAFLARICQQDDLLIGTVSTTRTRPEWEGLVGYFLNHLVLRTQIEGTPTYQQLLQQTKENFLQSLQHQAFPFAKLVERLRPQRDPSRSPLVQTMFIWDKPRKLRPPTNASLHPQLHLDPLLMEQRGAAFDLTCIVFELEDELRLSLRYNESLFDESTVVSLAESFQMLLRQVVANPETPIRHFDLVPENQKSAIQKWNNTARSIDGQLTGYELFHQWVEKTPETIAFESSSGSLSYQESAKLVNRLADMLRSAGINRQSTVAICMRRGIEPLLGILATWKVGAAYLPLDPDHPTARLQSILDDARPNAILADSATKNQHSLVTKGCCLEFDLASLRTSPNEPASNENDMAELDPSSPAYIIYTSGSTGRPKGVVVPYIGIANLAISQSELFHTQPTDRCLQFASLSFDASVFEIIMALHAGATLVVLDAKTVRSTTSEIRDAIAAAEITIATLPPSLLGAIPSDQLPRLHTLISAGEACSEELVQRWSINRKLFNAYGPTETTVWATTKRCESLAGKPTLGVPISNTRIYITDSHLEQQPIGVPGELCIAGIGLATGYHGMPEMTAARFVPNPFDTLDGATLYRSGDFAKWNPHGEIEFLGRIDSQIKIHGNRVETEEIAAALRHCEPITDAFVRIDSSKSEPRIIAYVVPDSKISPEVVSQAHQANTSTLQGPQRESIHPESLRQQLSKTLPCYMLPAEYILIDHLPLTVNGKVDVSKLPSPSLTLERSSKETITPPSTETEKTLAAIWSEVLERDAISIDDNFFDIGGASLKALQAAELAKNAGITLAAEHLFQYQTIRELAKAVVSFATESPTVDPLNAAQTVSGMREDERSIPRQTVESVPQQVTEKDLPDSLDQPLAKLRMAIESLGMYVPPKSVTTTAIVEGCRQKLDFPLERMTGIETRHTAGETEFSIDLARHAAEECLRNSRYQPNEIDLLIACNISRYDGPDFEISFEPSTAVRLQGMLGIARAETFDICNACAGFFTALLIAQHKLLSGEASRALLISGEYITHLSKTAQMEIEGFLDPRLACLTLGDAGIAMIVELRDDGTGFEALEMFTKGQHHDLCIAKETDQPHGGAIMYTDAIKASAVTLNYAVDHAAEILNQHGWTPEEIDHVIIHQTSSTTIDGAVEQLNRHFGSSIEAGVKAVNNLRHRGNTATTTHWVAVMDLIRQGRIHDDDQAVFAISGSGQTIGTALYRFDDLPSRLLKKSNTRRLANHGCPRPVASFPLCGVRIAAASTVGPLETQAPHNYSDFSVVELAARASQNALQQAKWSKDCIELMIHTGVYRDAFLSEPAVAAILAGCLQINTDEATRTGKRTLAFDLSAGAVGTFSACRLSATMIRNGAIRHALVTAAEVENNAADGPRRKIAQIGSALTLEAAPAGIGFGSFFNASYPEFSKDLRVFTHRSTGRAELVIQQSEQWLTDALNCLTKTALQFAREQGTTLDRYQHILITSPPGFAADELADRLGTTAKKIILPDPTHQDALTSGLAALWQQALESTTPQRGDRWLLVSVGSGIEVGCVEYCH